MNRCSKLLRYVYEIPNAFIGRISQAEPKKLASVVKPNTRHALGIAVDFVGDHLKDKKGDRISTHWTSFYLKNWDFRSPFQQSKLFL